ncbi:uncharacterized protein LOC129795072 [Lutzomyia longipalpis]|uniref:uncharacterized protein LOC129795072 n=1 Tax=Lutzomyia longipalpis TaxID=7200 RepID=UPI002483A5BF|nr:uncharacterized protein LOC129795072 [Lutzomyia longipalpis]
MEMSRNNAEKRLSSSSRECSSSTRISSEFPRNTIHTNNIPMQDTNSLCYKSDSTAREFFDELEEQEKSPLPEYLKNLIYLNGFANKWNFTAITEAEVDRMEKMCKEEMPDFCPHTTDYFSFFSQCIEHFRISRGHRIQLMSHVEGARKMKNSEDATRVPHVSHDTSQFPVESNRINFPDIVAKIRRKIKEVALRSNLTEICDADQLQIYVKMENREIQGAVLCPTCGRDIKLNKDRRRIDKNGQPVISGSNFLAHLRKHSKISERTPEEYTDESEVEAKRRRSEEAEVLHTTIKYEIDEY